MKEHGQADGKAPNRFLELRAIGLCNLSMFTFSKKCRAPGTASGFRKKPFFRQLTSTPLFLRDHIRMFPNILSQKNFEVSV